MLQMNEFFSGIPNFPTHPDRVSPPCQGGCSLSSLPGKLFFLHLFNKTPDVMQIDCIEPGYYYHIYNQGINKEVIFRQDRHYHKFLELCEKYLPSKVDILAYCLLPNHFHFLVFFPEHPTHPDRVSPPCQGAEALRHLFNAYAQWFNKKTDRTGGLFRRPFRRKRITDDEYLKQVVYYIHRNPLHHKLSRNPADWEFSSFRAIAGSMPTMVNRDQVLDWFDDRDNFIEYHKEQFNLDEEGMLE
jgi:REP element-mobilizing transposase RayT